MLRAVYLALVAGLVLLSVRSFADVTGLWPLPGAASRNAAEAANIELRTKPLEARAYYALAIAADRGGEDKRAAALFARSVELDPRLRAARLSLLNNAVNAKDAATAVRHARILAALSPQATGPVATVLAGLTLDPAARRVIAAEAKDSPLILAVASRASASGLDARAVRELLAPTDLAKIPNGIGSAQALLVGKLIRDGRYKEARETWYDLAGLRAEDAIFDGAFRGLTGSAPFGWTLRNATDVQTALETDPTAKPSTILELTAFGSLPVIAAEQTLVLPAGTYRLRFEAASDTSPRGGASFAWRITCVGGPLISEVPIALAGSDWQRVQATLEVPPACPAQVLRLTKLRTPNGDARKLKVTGVAVTRL